MYNVLFLPQGNRRDEEDDRYFNSNQYMLWRVESIVTPLPTSRETRRLEKREGYLDSKPPTISLATIKPSFSSWISNYSCPIVPSI